MHRVGRSLTNKQLRDFKRLGPQSFGFVKLWFGNWSELMGVARYPRTNAFRSAAGPYIVRMVLRILRDWQVVGPGGECYGRAGEYYWHLFRQFKGGTGKPSDPFLHSRDDLVEFIMCMDTWGFLTSTTRTRIKFMEKRRRTTSPRLRRSSGTGRK